MDRIFADISQAPLLEAGIKPVSRWFLDLINGACNFERAELRMIDPVTGKQSVIVHSGLELADRPHPGAFDRATNESIALRRVVMTSATGNVGVPTSGSPVELRSAVIVPILQENEVVATLGLFRSDAVGFEVDSLEFVVLLSSLFAPALNDARCLTSLNGSIGSIDTDLKTILRQPSSARVSRPEQSGGSAIHAYRPAARFRGGARSRHCLSTGLWVR